jgi:hypothetical protein
MNQPIPRGGTEPLKVGDRVQIVPEWQDPGDAQCGRHLLVSHPLVVPPERSRWLPLSLSVNKRTNSKEETSPYCQYQSSSGYYRGMRCYEDKDGSECKKHESDEQDPYDNGADEVKHIGTFIVKIVSLRS